MWAGDAEQRLEVEKELDLECRGTGSVCRFCRRILSVEHKGGMTILYQSQDDLGSHGLC